MPYINQADPNESQGTVLTDSFIAQHESVRTVPGDSPVTP